jgi:hypothetical protein
MHRLPSWRTATVAVLSAPLVVAGLLSAPAAAATPPAPASNLQLSSEDGHVYATWTASPATSSANACYLPGDTAPATPSDSGATCSGVTTTPGYSFSATDGQHYAVSDFSYDTNTSTYGNPVSATIVGSDTAPDAPLSPRTAGGGTTSLSFYWQTNPATNDLKDYLVSWSAGTATPPAPTVEDSDHVTSSTSMYISGLTSGTVYAFAVRARDLNGHVGAPSTVLATVRQPQIGLLDDTSGSVTASTFYYQPANASSTMPSAGVIRTGFTQNNYIYAATHSASQGWYSQYIGRQTGARNAFIATGPSGFQVIAWTSNGGAYYATKAAHGGKWGSVHHATSSSADRVVGVTADNNKRVHLLILRTAGTGRGLWYVTNGSGTWTRTLIAGTGATDVGVITRDPSTNRIVLVDRHRSSTTETIRVTVIAATAKKPGTFATWLSTRNRAVQWRPSSVAAYGGAITVGVQRTTTPASTSDGPYLLSGTAKSHRSAVRVAGTSNVDVNLLVSAPGAKRVVVNWQRRNAAWDPSKLGIWTVLRTYNAKTGVWTFATARHWTRSAYDVPAGAFRDTSGHMYVVHVTVSGDVRP